MSLTRCVINFYELDANSLVMWVCVGRKEPGDDDQRLVRTGNAFSVFELRRDRCEIIQVDRHCIE